MPDEQNRRISITFRVRVIFCLGLCLVVDDFRNDVTQSALFARLFLLAKGVCVLHCVVKKRSHRSHASELLRR